MEGMAFVIWLVGGFNWLNRQEKKSALAEVDPLKQMTMETLVESTKYFFRQKSGNHCMNYTRALRS